MELFIWRNYVSNDEETMSDKIFDLLCEDCKDIAVVEAEVESEWCNVEEEIASVKGIFDLMKNGYIFLEHIGKE
jgi:hypothetical protein